MTTQPQSTQPTRVGDYAVLTKLGEGGMGIVHLARGADGRRVALKVLRPHIVGDDEARARLAREVASLERVRSPWIAEILDADPWADVPYVVTRYVPGLSLHDQVAEDGPIADRDLHWLAGCLAEGIAAVHSAGVLHRDVKPSNVLMEGRTPILIDFGLARVADDPRLTQTGWLLGTPGYLAPEILYGDDATPASDVHAWAATVAYAGNGRAPYGRGPSMAIMDRARRGEHDLGELSGSLRDVIAAALSPDPLERPSLHEILAWIRPLSTRPELPVADPPVADDFTLPLAVAAQGGTPTPVLPPPPPPHRTRVLETEVGPVPPVAPFPAAAPTLGPAPLAHQPPPAHAMEQLEQDWDQQWGEPYPPVAPKPPLAERLRRGMAVGCGAVLLGAATAAAPYVTAAAVLVAVWLLRAGSLAASSVASKRLARGAKWHDGIGFAVSSPWHLLRAITGTVVLVLWSAGIAAAAGLICYALATGVATMLFTGGTALGVALWTGIASSRFRGPLSRVVHPLSRTWVPWSALCGGLLVAAGVLAAVAASRGIAWLPADSGPFGL